MWSVKPTRHIHQILLTSAHLRHFLHRAVQCHLSHPSVHIPPPLPLQPFRRPLSPPTIAKQQFGALLAKRSDTAISCFFSMGRFKPVLENQTIFQIMREEVDSDSLPSGAGRPDPGVFVRHSASLCRQRPNGQNTDSNRRNSWGNGRKVNTGRMRENPKRTH